MVLAQELKRLVGRRKSVVNESVEALLPCRHMGRAPIWKVNLSVKGSRRTAGKPDKPRVSAYIG